jgi:hypothetical protein
MKFAHNRNENLDRIYIPIGIIVVPAVIMLLAGIIITCYPKSHTHQTRVAELSVLSTFLSINFSEEEAAKEGKWPNEKLPEREMHFAHTFGNSIRFSEMGLVMIERSGDFTLLPQRTTFPKSSSKRGC